LAKGNNTIKYRKHKRFNVGIVIFAILLLYVLFSARTLLNRDSVKFYEVTEGVMAMDTEFTGIAVRNEKVGYASRTGYVNYLVGSGRRVKVGGEIYSLDETGNLTSFLQNETADGSILSDDQIYALRTDMKEFFTDFDTLEFSNVYPFKNKLQSDVLDYAGIAMYGDLEQKLAESGISYAKVYSDYAGIVNFNIDGYEDRAIESLKLDDFDKSQYSVVHNKSGQLVEQGSPVYKISTSEKWDIVFPLSEEEKVRYSKLTYMIIRFKGSDITATGDYAQFIGADGLNYGRISLDKYMVDYASDRYVTFDIVISTEEGLKIPKSAVVSKTFLTVPCSYLSRGGDDMSEGFYKEVLIDGVASIAYIPTDIFYSDGEYYYIDSSSDGKLQPGDNVVMPNTGEKYQLGQTANLSGVYNINKGYAVFKQITIIDSNDEFYTVLKNQKYGLNVYDHILYDPEGISEGDFIYQ